MGRWLFALLPVVHGCVSTTEVPEGWLTISQEQQASWVRNFNPLLTGEVRWPTRAGIYEPLAIHNAVAGEWVPWLATRWEWNDEATRLSFEIREGVRWSDGTAFDAADVVFTFELIRDQPGLDGGGVWKEVQAVHLEDNTVHFDFRRPYTPGMAMVALAPIVPEHIWSEVEEPTRWANPEPVGTGPFTEVLRFTHQEWVLGANPHYWMEGQPTISALRFPALPSNEAANMALITGEVDWAGNFIPAVDRIFVGRDPANHDYWFQVIGGSVMLYPNTTRPHLEKPEVRKAISLSINRELVTQVGMYGYVEAAHPSGLSDGHQSWRIEPEQSWVVHDPEQAEALLVRAGYSRGPDGRLKDATGETIEVEIIAPSGWSDWVRSAQVIASNLNEVGFDAQLRTYDFSAWFQKLMTGDFDLAISWTEEGATPYNAYRFWLSQAQVQPLGTPAARNWGRFGSPKADVLLAEMEATVDVARQQELAAGLQRIFYAEAPAIPLFPAPSWGAFNRSRFVGWPSKDDPYARLSPNFPPENLLVLTRVRPR